MRRGTTPTISLTIPDDVANVMTDCRVTFEQRGENIIDKKLADCIRDGRKIIINLTQDDTLKFAEGEAIKIQVKVKYGNGKVISHKPKLVMPEEILNDEVL